MKRTWKTNIWGNTVGYEGTRRAVEFGCNPWVERQAMAWCDGMSVEDAEIFALENPTHFDTSKERK